MHRQLAEILIFQQPQHNDYSQYEMYLAQSSITTPIPTFAPPQPHHPLTDAAPINWPIPQSSLGGAAAANISHNGYALSML
uniref:Uncharacterized protein n=1 Tax=Panagrolaimus superbus TaxID=310955 RepID=A0A914YZU7_9BILA